jgi:hypothetical protein
MPNINITITLSRERNKLRAFALSKGWDGEMGVLNFLENYFTALIKSEIVNFEKSKGEAEIEVKKLAIDTTERTKLNSDIADLETDLQSQIVIDVREV